ncbi:hypothetical protein STSO111631_06205 [Stackebrandtia soli]
MVAGIAIIATAGTAVAHAAEATAYDFGFGPPGGPLIPPRALPVTPPDDGDASGTPVEPADGTNSEDGLGTFELTLSTDVERAVRVTLTCQPEGGTHPGDVMTACSQLTNANGEVAAINPSGMLCTKQFEPITATLEGTWNGRSVRYSQEFGNACEANSVTGGVLFGFWDTLG